MMKMAAPCGASNPGCRRLLVGAWTRWKLVRPSCDQMDRPGGLSYLGHDIEQLLLHFVAHLKHLGVGLKLIASGEQSDRFGAEVDGIRRLYGSVWLGCLG